MHNKNKNLEELWFTRDIWIGETITEDEGLLQQTANNLKMHLQCNHGQLFIYATDK